MSDPRHLRRMKLVQNLFSVSFPGSKAELPNPDAPIEDILQHLPAIDEKIRTHAPKYPLERIAKSDLAILRLSVYELTVAQEEPPKVVIDEAVTLAREFGSDRSYAFVNAVLGAIFKTTKKP
ncbi:MAG: transcription antitermination protein NusB [Patescibacteria group bacterium]|nr:transcription antitermination protein NusB [Patescibacteria group bacterium]